MSKQGSGFWSSTAGILTGAAGVLTGVVGLLTVLVQLDVIGGDSDGRRSVATSQQGLEADRTNGRSRTDTTTRSTGSGISGSTDSSSIPSFEVEPEQVEFAGPLGGQETVTVRNRGREPLPLEQPEIQGSDQERFRVDDTTCGPSVVDPGDDCRVTLSFQPEPDSDSEATLVMGIADSSQTVEVPLKGERLL